MKKVLIILSLVFVLVSCGKQDITITDSFKKDVKEYYNITDENFIKENTVIVNNEDVIKIFKLVKEGKRGVDWDLKHVTTQIVDSDNLILYNILYQIKGSYYFGKKFFLIKGYEKGNENVIEQYNFFKTYFKDHNIGNFTEEGEKEVLKYSKINEEDYFGYFSINSGMNYKNSIAEGVGDDIRIYN